MHSTEYWGWIMNNTNVDNGGINVKCLCSAKVSVVLLRGD